MARHPTASRPSGNSEPGDPVVDALNAISDPARRTDVLAHLTRTLDRRSAGTAIAVALRHHRIERRILPDGRLGLGLRKDGHDVRRRGRA